MYDVLAYLISSRKVFITTNRQLCVLKTWGEIQDYVVISSLFNS